MSRLNRQAAVITMMLTLLAIYEAFIAVRVIVLTMMRWSNESFLALPFILITLLMVDLTIFPYLVYLGFARTKSQHVRLARAATQGDANALPTLSYQPQVAEALGPGETLRLKTAKPFWMMAIGWLGYTFSLAGLCFVCESLLSLALPDARAAGLEFLSGFGVSALATVTPLDWISLAFPILVCVWIWSVLVRNIMDGAYTTLTADDKGITLRKTGNLRRFIAWQDIAYAIRSGNNTAHNDIFAGSYALLGHTRWLEFSIRLTPFAPMPLGYAARGVRFIDSPETYEVDARRLVATIVARSGQPIRYWRKSPGLISFMPRNTGALLTEDAAAALPVASESWQPNAEAVNAMRAQPAPHLLVATRSRTPLFPPTQQFLAALVFLLIPLYLILAILVSIVASLIALPLGMPVQGINLEFAIPIIVVSLIAPLALILPIVKFARTPSGVSAWPKGLVGTRGSRALYSTVILWESVRAWVVIPGSADGKRPTAYTVIAGARRISWVEPEGAKLAGRVEGDRVAAFRARAEALHALIVARTGLPLMMSSGDNK